MRYAAVLGLLALVAGAMFCGCISVKPGAALFVAYGNFPGVAVSSGTAK